jgi:uncharacterized protein (TIGR02757 family)
MTTPRHRSTAPRARLRRLPFARDAAALRLFLDGLYERWNRRGRAHPDPVCFLHRFADPDDREVAGLAASALAYGRVAYIMKSVGTALAPLGDRPAQALDAAASVAEFRRRYDAFSHRWTRGPHVAGLLWAAREVRREHGSLGAAFRAGVEAGDADYRPALSLWVRLLRARDAAAGALLPDPADGSACKRLHLYLRWMVRRDEIDPGGWDGLSPARLTVPLDTHLHRLARDVLGFTRRGAADGRAAAEITAAFARLRPEDPVRYDFALTRWSMSGRTDLP